jgi:hypothetical protein
MLPFNLLSNFDSVFITLVCALLSNERRKKMKPNPNAETDRLVFATSGMDGPSVRWTVNDLAAFNNKFFLTYHCMGAGYDFLSPVGCLVGLALPFTKYSKFARMTSLQAAGTGGIVAGTAGMALGLAAVVGKAYSSNAEGLPMDNEGIEQRVNGLKHNYIVRSMDRGVWLGVAAMGGAMAYAGGPAKLGFSPGLLGGMQALGVASGVASVLTMGYVSATK